MVVHWQLEDGGDFVSKSDPQKVGVGLEQIDIDGPKAFYCHDSR